jgi:tRNA (guanine6-N2)-methyltransferase
MVTLIFTTNPGLEDIVGQEFGQRLRQAGLVGPLTLELGPFGLKGNVLVGYDAPLEALWNVAQQMHSVHHVLTPIHSFDVPQTDTLEAIKQAMIQCEVVALEAAASFRVTTKRYGTHCFTSTDVQIAAGAGLVERYGTKVDLEGYAVNVRVDIHEWTGLVGLQLSRRSLSKRHQRLYTQRTSLKSVVAYAMLRLAELPHEGGALLDPFCGSGTILMEAASVFPQFTIYGSDSSDKAVEGTRRNLQQAGAVAAQLCHCNAQAVDEAYGGTRFRAIVTNPPYGVRLFRGRDLYVFYRDFLQSAYKVLEPGGKVVVLVWQRGVFNRAVHNLGLFRVVHKRWVETGGIFPRIYVLESVVPAGS